VLVNADAIAEPDETFVARLSNPMNAALGKATGIATIKDTPPPPPPPTTRVEPEDKPRKPTEQERYQNQHTNRGSQDDTVIRGQIQAIRADAQPPIVVIASRDGLVELELRGDALKVLPSLRVGQHVVGSGEKVHELYYIVDDLGLDD
jgi:hypothetical protein